MHVINIMSLSFLESTHTSTIGPWVSVGGFGEVYTITPVVTTISGTPTTLSAVPDSLTKIGTYTLSPDGATSTYTGLPPAITAAGSGAGAFLPCQSGDTPFCQPHEGALLNVGGTYFGRTLLLLCSLPHLVLSLL
jgi:hypothetical protein